MKKMKLKKIVLAGLSVLLGTQWSAGIVATTPVQAEESNKIDLILDWVPNTNHTGLYVALDQGYFDKVGVEVDVKRPPEGSTTELVGLGKAAFGISFQDSLASRLAGGLPVTAVAAILEHNTSGIIARQDAAIEKPSDLSGHTYGTWNDPIELGMLKYLLEKESVQFDDVTLIPNQDDNSIIGLANKAFESAWVYYAWDGIMASYQNIDTTYFNFRDFAEELDYYSPVIIANNDYIQSNKEEASKVIQAIKKGYQYAIDHPKEAADILIKYAPELEDQHDFVVASQEWISTQYASNKEAWGHIDEARWNKFYQWLYDNKLVDKDLTTGQYFTNDLLGE